MEAEQQQQVHCQFVLQAVDQASQAVKSGKGEPFGSLIVRGDKVIAINHNRLYADFDPTAHAEMVVIRQACKDEQTTVLKDCTLYSSAQPCPMCMTAIRMSGIDKVYYCVAGQQVSEAFGKIQDFKAIGLHDKQDTRREVPQEQINCEEGLQVLNSYFQKNISDKKE